MVLLFARNSPRRGALLASAAGVALFTLLVFWPVSRYPFLTIWDDAGYVVENEMVRAGVTRAGVRWSFTTFSAANWHPLTWLSHMADVELFGLDAGAHHLSSLAIHLATALLLLVLFERLTGRLWRSAMVSLLFSIHPLHVESVVRVSARKDVLSALFWMLTIAAYLRYVRRPGPGRYLPVVLAFSLGLAAKPMVVTLPLVLLLLDYWPLGRLLPPPPGAGGAGLPARTIGPGRLLLEKAPLLALAAAGSIATWAAQSTYGKAAISLDLLPLSLRLANAAVSCVTYLVKAAAPRGLAFFYPYPIDGYPPLIVTGALVIITGFTYLALREQGRRPFLLAGWGWYLVSLLPVIGIVQVGLQARADRYTYLPLIGVFVLFVWAAAEFAQRLPGRRKSLIAAGGATAILCAVLARVNLGFWRDTVSMTRHAIEVTSGNWVAQVDLASYLKQQGREEESLQAYRAAESHVPARAERHFRSGQTLAGQGRIREATVEYGRAASLYPPYVMANYNLAVLESREGDQKRAAEYFRAAIGYRPDFVEAHFARGVILSQRGEREEAAAHFAEALRFRPDFPGARHNLAVVLEDLEHGPQRIEEYLRGSAPRASTRPGVPLTPVEILPP